MSSCLLNLSTSDIIITERKIVRFNIYYQGGQTSATFNYHSQVNVLHVNISFNKK